MYSYSAAFDTIDHDILISRLSSWFGFCGSVLNWFKSYLSSILLVFLFLWCSSGLCSLSFAFHHVHDSLSTLISSLSLNHHLYADDTQLFFSFHPLDFDSNITHLQNALQQICSWKTANLLTLNFSRQNSCHRTYIYSKQLAKIHNSSLSTTHSARNLGFIFDEHLSFSDQISTLPQSCYYHIG